ncbi:MAG: type II toxin-antitoxin system HicA family toxin [bacterium]
MPNTILKFSLPLSIFKEGKAFVAYAPALDLSTSGKTFEEVKRRFTEVVNIFFGETAKKGTLDTILQELGWQKVQRNWVPPFLVAQTLENMQVFDRQEGDHRIYWRVDLKRPVVFPQDKDIPVFIIRNNLRTLGMSTKEYLAIIQKI